MSPDRIHRQLLADCHYLGRLPATGLLLHRNASLPWFILVPDTRLGDFLDLPQAHRCAVLDDCAAISAFIKQVLGFDKVNFAALGNVVSQMHLHVIGRHQDDPCWPQPVWGNLHSRAQYEGDRVREWRDALVKMAALVPGTAAEK
jgi:diadenosine tetraphosphate (Ap4A) HIT family hydrolase